MPQTPPATIKAEVPERLLAQMQVLVEAGWFHDMNDLVIEALRRLVDTHRPDLMEHFVRKDVEWGLGGEE
jgi:Arc/MetJ-type ribon-helix-helix transcriptional regulator